MASESRRIRIAGRDAVSVHVEAGAAIQCVRGRIWLTQEGDMRDYTIPAGTTFCTDRAGRAVLTAIDDTSVVFVRTPDDGVACVPGTVAIHSEQQLEHGARVMRAQHLGAAFRAALAWLRGPLATRRP